MSLHAIVLNIETIFTNYQKNNNLIIAKTKMQIQIYDPHVLFHINGNRQYALTKTDAATLSSHGEGFASNLFSSSRLNDSFPPFFFFSAVDYHILSAAYRLKY